MISVLDTTRDGWKFVRMLSEMGNLISWTVPKENETALEILPINFRGCIHRVGFRDPLMIRSAMANCEQILVLVDDLSPSDTAIKAMNAIAAYKSPAIPSYLVKSRSGTFEISNLDLSDTSARAPEPVKSTNNLLQLSHVG